MIKFHAKSPLSGETVSVIFDDSGASIDGPGIEVDELQALLDVAHGLQGKPIELKTMSPHDFSYVMDSSAWKAVPVDGYMDYEEVSEIATTGAGKTVRHKEEPILDRNPGTILDAADLAEFEAMIKGADSFDEIEEIFFDAIDDLAANEQEKSLDFGVKAGQAVVAREKLNARVIQLIDSIDASHVLTSEERDLLASYTGRGGLKSENSETEYYTPQHAAESTWEMLKKNGFNGGSVGEPSCGSGVFLGTKPAKTKVVASELSNISSKVCNLLNPDDDVDNLSFEEQAASMPDHSLDAIIGNVPFSNSRPLRSRDPAYADREDLTLEQYFIVRSIDKVRYGGLVGLLIPTRVVDRKSKGFTQFRREISRKAEFLGAVRMPSKTFKKGQHGTEVPVDVILLKKHPKDLLEKIKAADPELLEETKVFYNEFIQGNWFIGAGKKYLLGAQSMVGEQRKRLVVAFDGSEQEKQAAIRKALGTKFDSRIDWAALESAEVNLPQYTEGDSQTINGVQHELENGKWVSVNFNLDLNSLDEYKFGAESMDQLRDQLKTPEGCLTLSYDQVQAVNKTWPKMLLREFPQANAAFLFGGEVDGPLQEIAWRGSLIGQVIARDSFAMQKGENDGEQLEIVQAIVSKEIHQHGNPHKAKVKRNSTNARDWMQYQASVQKSGGYNALLRGEVESSTVPVYDSTDPVSIIHYLTAQTIQLDVSPYTVLDLYDGLPPMTDIRELLDNEGIALTSSGNVMTMEHYLSGDLYKKLQQLNVLIRNESDMRKKAKFNYQRDYILKNRPFTELKDVNLKFTDKWTNPKYIEEFMDLAGYPFFYDKETKRWAHTGTAPKLFDQQLLKHLNRGFAFDKDGEWRKIKGGSKMLGANAAEYRDTLSDLITQFNDFMREHEESGLIAEQYNATFNTHMPVNYSEAVLGLENLSGDIAPHGFQNSTVRRISDDGKGIIGLDVGLGKTFTALALIQYNIQNGRSNRSAIVVPKSVLANWYHEARAIHKSLDHYQFIGISPVYGDDGEVQQEPVYTENKNPDGSPEQKKINGKLIFQDVIKEDTPEEIKTKLWAATQSNKKVFVMSQPQFGLIPLRPETMSEYTAGMVENEMLSNGSATDYLMSAAGYSEKERKKIKKDSAKDKDKPGFDYKEAQKLSKWQEKYDNDGTTKNATFPYYEDLRFDTVVVDEAHNYKNIYEASETRGLKYLAATDASARGTDMAIKMGHLKDSNNGRGPVMLTATPITNSPIEVYNALSLVTDMSEMERMGVKTPDDFVEVFASKGSVDVQKLSGEMVSVEGIVGFENLTALRNLFNRFAVVKTAKEVKFDNGINPPEAVEHQPEVDLDPEQTEIYATLREELELTILSMSDPENADLFDEDGQPLPIKPIFSIMRQMEQATTDVDLFYKQMTFRFPAKHEALVKDLLSTGIPMSITGKRYDPEKEKQVNVSIKRDETIPLERKGKLVQFVLPYEFEDAVVKRLEMGKFSKLMDTVSHPISGKYARLIDNIKKHIDDKGKQIVFTEEKREHGKLMRVLLASTSLKKSEIAIINATTAGKPEDLQAIADSYNRGDFKFIIANQKAEVGVNLQKGTSAIHHLTLPWTPASIQQRNGRGVRQGNTRSHVDVYYYVAKGSMDINRLGSLKAKANWIGQIMKSDQAKMENPDAASEASAELMRLTLGEEAYQARLDKMTAIKVEKDRVMKEKSALTQLAGLSKTARALKNIVYTVEGEMQEASKPYTTRRDYNGKLIGYSSLEEIERALGVMTEDNPRYEPLTKLVSDAKAKIESERGRLERRLASQKSKLEARDVLPFSREVLDNPEEVISPRNMNFALYAGCYVRIVPFKQKDNDFDGHAVYSVGSINMGMETISISRVSGDYWVTNKINGNARENYSVPFNKWPAAWKPIAASPELELEVEIAQLNGNEIYSYINKFSKDDLVKYGDIESISSGSMFLFDGKGVVQFGTYYDMPLNERNFGKVVFPEPGNDVIVTKALELARESFGAGSNNAKLLSFLKAYVGGENYMARYNEEFKIKDISEAGGEYDKAFTEFVNGLDDEVLVDREALYKWLLEDVNWRSEGMIERYEVPLRMYLESVHKEGYDNYDDIVIGIERIETRLMTGYRSQASITRGERLNREAAEAREAERVETEKARALKEAADAVEREEIEAKSKAAQEAFAAEGGAVLSAEQKAGFARHGLDAEIITREWEYLDYTGRNKKTVKGKKFPAGKYIKLEGATQKDISRGDNGKEIAARFKLSHKGAGLYFWPKTLSKFVGRPNEDITLTPVSDIESDVKYYLELLDR